MLTVQKKLLRWTGFLPLSEKSDQAQSPFQRCLVKTFQWLIAMTFLLGTAFSCARHMLTLVDTFTSSSNSTSLSGSSRGILLVLSTIPYIAINIRGLFILLLLLLKRKSLSNLPSETDHFLSVCFPSKPYRKSVLKNLERWSITLGILVILLHAVYDTIDDVVYYGTVNLFSESPDTLTWPRLSALQSVMIWIIFSDVPFVLSQQAFLYPVLLALLLNRAIKDLKYEMKTATEQFSETKGAFISEKDVELWRTKHMAMLKFCGLINESFNLILFFVYGSDIMTLLGYTCSLTNISSNEPMTTYLRLVFNCIVFAYYGALIPIPLVCVYENSESLGFMVYRLKVTADERINSAKEDELVEALEELERICRGHVCIFNGAKLIYYSRGFLVGISTLVPSVTLVVREFVNRR